MRSLVERFISSEAGTTAVEYGLIGVLLSLAIVSAASDVGEGVKEKFDSVASQVSSAMKRN